MPESGGLQPDAGVDLSYFLNDAGNAKATADMPGPGPTWIGGLTVLQGDDHRERSEPVFFALPVDQSDAPATTKILFEFMHGETGEYRYSTSAIVENGFSKTGEVCRVWSAEQAAKNLRP